MNSIFYLIVGISIFDFIFGRVLSNLNKKNRTAVLPKELEGIYDDEKYRKQQSYENDSYNFSKINSVISFSVTLAMFVFFGFNYVNNIVLGLSDNSIIQALLFFGILMFASDILSTPFDIYDTFVIEEKYGFNKTTIKIYLLDKLKGWLIGAIIGGGLLALITWLYILTTSMFWLYAWLTFSVVTIFITMFYSSIIVPLFNKQTPLEDGELKTAINNFAVKVGFKLDNIFVIDGSKRSTKANAYFTGLGSKKRIVLYDTLIKEMTIEEIVAVLAHEIGHYKNKHTVSGMILGILQMGLTMFILSLFVGKLEFTQALIPDATEPIFYIGLISFSVLYGPLSMIIGLFMNILSRKNEYEADKFADDNYNGEYLISALKKLTSNNLSNLTPHPIYVFFHFSHPTLLQRILAIKRNTK